MYEKNNNKSLISNKLDKLENETQSEIIEISDLKYQKNKQKDHVQGLNYVFYTR
jgi:hypothetical protein